MAPSNAKGEQAGEIPAAVLQEARAAAAGNAQANDESAHRASGADHAAHHQEQDIGHVPAPPYNATDYGQLDISQNGLDTGAKVAADGRVNIKINQRNRKLTNLLVPALRHQLDLQQRPEEEPYIPKGLAEYEGLPPPPMNIVIQIVGSRGDVQPFIALGQVLKNKYNHRVRVATHPNFKDFVTENGLEFFSIGGDPAELMAFMVKNPGLMPGFDSLKNGDIGKRRKGIYEIVIGCWRSCIEAGDGTGVQASDDLLEGRSSFDSGILMGGDPSFKPFVADAIIANPPSFAHMHIAEKLGIPLHLMFTMPWSPTQSFPHPLANLLSSNADSGMTNFLTYALVDMMTWQGLGDVINRFREKTLHLEPVSIMWAPGMASRLRIPYTYCWSPALIPKPADWGNYIDVSGFYFLNLATNFTPSPELAEFLDAGPPPIYIGFGSIVVDDPTAMTKMIFEAVRKTGQRALVSKGWGGLGADELGIPEGVFMLGNCPHDWLFKRVSCVVHHGGAGTTAAGISAGRPTVVVPFFGDQPFWGAMCARAGAGPPPIPYKNLTAVKLASQIEEALKPESLERAKELSEKIRRENGSEAGCDSFHKQLRTDDLRCSLYPQHVAVWRVKRTDIRLCGLAAAVLGHEGLLDFSDLKLYRPREYETEDGPWDPFTGGASALIGTIGNLSMGIADIPVELIRSLKTVSSEAKDKEEQKGEKQSTQGTSSASQSRHGSTVQSLQSSTNVSKEDLPAPSSPQTASDPEKDSTVSAEKTLTSPSETSLSLPTETEDAQSVMSPSMSAISTIISPDGTVSGHHRRWSRHGSGSHSPRRTHAPHSEAGQVTLESAIGGAKAASRIVSAGMKSPMDFTMGLAKGFHNAPKLYGDETVRKSEKVTDIQSGLKAAGKEFGFGFYDGITGLVTQPMAGAQKEGFAGFMKGAAKGIGGLILKPGAAIWGLPGYTAKGIYASLQSLFGSSVQNYIIAARTAQGYEEWKSSTPEQQQQIISAWKSSKLERKRGGKKYGKERKAEIEQHISRTRSNNETELLTGFKNTKHMSWDERKVLAEQKKLLKEERKGQEKHRKGSGTVKSRCKYCPFDHDSDYHIRLTEGLRSQASPAKAGKSDDKADDKLNDEYEEAIQKSVTATSRGDPEEDKMIERALRASMKELEKAQSGEKTEEDYERAIAASIQEAKATRAGKGEPLSHEQETGVTSTSSDAGRANAADDNEEDHDAELTRALTQSLKDHKADDSPPHYHYHHNANGREWSDSEDSGLGTEEDENYLRTLEESKRHHTEREQSKKDSTDDKAATTSTTMNDVDDNEDDEDFKRAMSESTKHEEDIQRQRTEEEIVLEYIKKQSLLEEEARRQKAGAGQRAR